MKLKKIDKILAILKKNSKYLDYDIEICNFSLREDVQEYFEINEEDKEIYFYDIEDKEK